MPHFNAKEPNPVEFLPDGTVRMELTQGKFCILDVEDYPRVRPFRWFARKLGNGWYANTNNRSDLPELKAFSMHRVLFPCDGCVDHINGDTLDNRRCNLRQSSIKENVRNSGLSKRNKTGFKGVTILRGKFRSTIVLDQKQRHLGIFVSAEEAALAYDSAAIKLFGEFARTNEAMGLLPHRSIQ